MEKEEISEDTSEISPSNELSTSLKKENMKYVGPRAQYVMWNVENEKFDLKPECPKLNNALYNVLEPKIR